MKLVFGIPTYNGAKYIEQTLLSIVEQIPDLPVVVKIEVLVQDNGSTDNTSEIIARIANSFPGTIRYKKNSSNLGYDRNLLEIFESADGDFLKLIGDDDVLMPGGLRKIVEPLCRSNSVDVAVYNFETVDENLLPLGPTHVLNGGLSGIYLDGDEFIQRCDLRYGQLSAVLFRIERLQTLNLNSAIGTQYLHIAAVMGMGPRLCGLIVSEPLIKVRQGSPNFEKTTADRLLVPLGSIRIYRRAEKHGWKSSTLKGLIRFNQKYLLRRTLSAKIDRLQGSFDVARRLSKECWDYPSFWFVFLPILLLPRQVAALVRRIHDRLQQRAT